MRVVYIVSIFFTLAACTQARFETRAANFAASASGAITGGDGNGATGTINQPGGGNGTGTLTQPPVLQQCESTGNFSSSPNSAGRIIVYQSNSSNYSSVIQVGSDNFAQVTQNGSSNVSCIYQSGANNSATVTQTGSGGSNSATTVQVSGGSQAPTADGQTCLCELLSYCQSDSSAAICQSLQ